MVATTKSKSNPMATQPSLRRTDKDVWVYPDHVRAITLRPGVPVNDGDGGSGFVGFVERIDGKKIVVRNFDGRVGEVDREKCVVPQKGSTIDRLLPGGENRGESILLSIRRRLEEGRLLIARLHETHKNGGEKEDILEDLREAESGTSEVLSRLEAADAKLFAAEVESNLDFHAAKV